MFPYYEPPKKKLNTGTHWRKSGETLSWVLILVEEHEVKLSGPGPCRGTLRVERSEFERKWVRA